MKLCIKFVVYGDFETALSYCEKVRIVPFILIIFISKDRIPKEVYDTKKISN